MCVYLYVYVCECICRVCPEGIQPCNMIYRDIYWRTCKIQDTLYTGQCHLNPFKVGTLDLTQFSQSPSAAPSYFPECRWQYEISSLPKVILVLGKAKSHRAPNLGLSVAESPGWFDVLPKNSAQDMMHEQAHCCDEAANHQLPIAEAFWIIWIVSAKECLSLMQHLMQIRASTHSVILNATATQYTCSLYGVYHLRWPVQWCHHCSHMHIPVHSPWLPVCINVVRTVLIILTMGGLFPDRPHIYNITCHMYTHLHIYSPLLKYNLHALKFTHFRSVGRWVFTNVCTRITTTMLKI